MVSSCFRPACSAATPAIGMQILFQALGAVHVGQAVGQPEEESSEKSDHGKRLLLDQFLIGGAPTG